MTQEEIKKVLPHRDAMLLIDEAEEIDGVSHAKKLIKGDEWFLNGHFPGDPVVPGVILCEILAQSTCVLLAPGGRTLFSGIDKVRFKNIVKPGDLFETECVITKSRPPFYWASGKGFVGGKLCVSADFSFAMIKQPHV